VSDTDGMRVTVHDPTVVEKTNLGHGVFARDLQLVPGARYKLKLENTTSDALDVSEVKVFVGSLRNFYVLDTLQTTVTLDSCVNYCFTVEKSLTDIGILIDSKVAEEGSRFNLNKVQLTRERKVNKNHPNKLNLSYLLNNDERQDVLARKTFKDDIRMETETCEGVIRRSVNECLVPIGSILPYAGDSAPCGYLLCDGCCKDVEDYPELFDVIGYSYGGCDGEFRLPNLRGRFPMGYNDDDERFNETTDRGPIHGDEGCHGASYDYKYTIVRYIIKSN